MCKECKKWEQQFEAGKMIFQRVTCPCPDCSVTESREDGKEHCIKCNCVIPIILIGLNDQEGFDDIWVDPVTKRPVEL